MATLTTTTEFNTVCVEIQADRYHVVAYVINLPENRDKPYHDIYASGVRDQLVLYLDNNHMRHPDNEDKAEVLRRVRGGTCDVYLRHLTDGEWIAYDDFPAHHFAFQLRHPFHPDRHLQGLWEFFHGLQYTPASDTMQECLELDMKFVHAGEIPNPLTTVRLYTRDDDTPGIPTVEPNESETTFFANLSNAGWTKDIPRGATRLWGMDIGYSSDTVEYDTPKRHYRVLDSASRIRVLARQYHTWESALTDENTHASFATTKKWWRGWIGRCWAEKPFNSDIRVFYVGDSANAIKRDARDVADWMVGHMEEWLAKPNGISDFRTEMNQALIQAQLDDQTFCHVKLTDGGIGDRLYNGTDGLTEAQFAVFQNAKYTEALGSIT